MHSLPDINSVSENLFTKTIPVSLSKILTSSLKWIVNKLQLDVPFFKQETESTFTNGAKKFISTAFWYSIEAGFNILLCVGFSFLSAYISPIYFVASPSVVVIILITSLLVGLDSSIKLSSDSVVQELTKEEQKDNSKEQSKEVNIETLKERLQALNKAKNALENLELAQRDQKILSDLIQAIEDCKEKIISATRNTIKLAQETSNEFSKIHNSNTKPEMHIN